MNSILRKTMVAVAVAGTFGANASTINSLDRNGDPDDGIQQVISAQGLQIANDEIVTGNTPTLPSGNQLRVEWTPEVQHVDQDAIVFTFTGAAIDQNTTINTVELQDAFGQPVPDVTPIGVDREEGTITFSVGTTPFGGNPNNNPNVLPRYYLTGVTLTDLASAVSVSSSSQRGLIPFDPSPVTEVAQVAGQWVLGAILPNTDRVLDAVISVRGERTSFASRFEARNDDLVPAVDWFEQTISTQTHLMTVTAGTVTSVVTTTGNFDWTLDEDNDFNPSSVKSIFAANGADVEVSLNDDQNELTLQLVGDADNGTSLWAFEVPGDVPLVESSYSSTTTVAYSFDADGPGAMPGTGGTLELGERSIGRWTLDGEFVHVEFMPYGSGIANFFYISNTSNVDAAIELFVYSDTGEASFCGDLSVNAAPESVTNLGAAVNEALAGCGLGNSGDRLALSFIINAPRGSIDLTAGYNSRGDRVLVD